MVVGGAAASTEVPSTAQSIDRRGAGSRGSRIPPPSFADGGAPSEYSNINSVEFYDKNVREWSAISFDAQLSVPIRRKQEEATVHGYVA